MTNGNEVVSVQFSPDGTRLLTASLDHSARIWDAHTGQPLTEPMKQSGAITMAQYSPDGKWVVTASRDHTVQVWDAQTGQALAEPFGNEAWVYSARFSPDGRRIVTATTNDVARVWDVSPPPSKYPAWLLPLAEAAAGEALNQEGVLVLTTNRLQVLQQTREELNRESSDDSWVAWGRWFLADRTARAISPFSRMTRREYFDYLVSQHTAASLNEAEGMAFGDTNLLRQITEARSRATLSKPKN